MSLLDDLLKHKILLQRLTTSQAKIMLSKVGQAQKIIEKALKKEHINYKSLEIKVKTKLNEAIKPTGEALIKFGKYEAEFISKVLQKHGFDKASVNVTEDILKSQLSTGLVTKNKTIRDTYKVFAAKKASDMVNSVKGPEVVEDKIFSLDRVVKGLVKTQLYSLSGTALNRVSSAVKEEVYQEAKIERVQWASTLDDSVCPDCEELDGQIFDLDAVPDCPLHANCRCELIPYDD